MVRFVDDMKQTGFFINLVVDPAAVFRLATTNNDPSKYFNGVIRLS